MSYENLSLAGKAALVTGATSGIGFATAKLMADRGATVLLTGRTEARLMDAAEAIPGSSFLVSDTSKIEHIEQLTIWLQDKVEGLDILILNAGITPFKPLGTWDVESFEALFHTNVRGPWFTIQALTDVLNDHASIVTLSSVAARRGAAPTAAYGSTKGALCSMTRGLVAALADRRIRVNTVSPGPIDTPAWDKIGVPQQDIHDIKSSILEANPLKRFGEPVEVAEAIAFLASSAASYVNGTDLVVDGGMLAV